MSDPMLDSTRNLAKWLQEAGHRKLARPAAQDAPAPQAPRSSPLPPLFDERITSTQWLAIAAVGALAYLQYFYADVLLQIASLRSVLVFLLVNGRLPPV